VLPGELQHSLETCLIYVTLSQLNFLFLKVKTTLNRRFSNTKNIKKTYLPKEMQFLWTSSMTFLHNFLKYIKNVTVKGFQSEEK
jgi:hypothetical protein